MNNHFFFFHWILIFIFGIAGLIFLIFAIRQFTSIKFPLQKSDQTRRSLIAAGWSSISFFFIVTVFGVIVWAETGVFRSVFIIFPFFICLVPFIFGITALGTYIQSIWYAKLFKFREDTNNRQGESFESHQQEPPSK